MIHFIRDVHIQQSWLIQSSVSGLDRSAVFIQPAAEVFLSIRCPIILSYLMKYRLQCNEVLAHDELQHFFSVFVDGNGVYFLLFQTKLILFQTKLFFLSIAEITTRATIITITTVNINDRSENISF